MEMATQRGFNVRVQTFTSLASAFFSSSPLKSLLPLSLSLSLSPFLGDTVGDLPFFVQRGEAFNVLVFHLAVLHRCILLESPLFLSNKASLAKLFSIADLLYTTWSCHCLKETRTGTCAGRACTWRRTCKRIWDFKRCPRKCL